MMPTGNPPEERLIEFPDQSSMDKRLNTDAYWKEDSKIRMVQPLGLRKTNQHQISEESSTQDQTLRLMEQQLWMFTEFQAQMESITKQINTFQGDE